ncbi:MAG: hypothetical protein ACK4IX_03835, partial [Candidatus Sericytochromatia bacterium]
LENFFSMHFFRSKLTSLILSSSLLVCSSAFANDENKSLMDMSLEEIVNIDIVTGDSGGFGKQLDELKIKPYFHGYSVFNFRNIEFRDKKEIPTFDMMYLNPIIGVNIQDKITSEMMLEFEHGGSEVGIRYGILDYSPFDFMTIRLGKFLVPIGKFNEYLYAEHINIFADRPLANSHIIPVVFADVGAQIRGNFKIIDDLGLNYAMYVSNGLQQKDDKYGAEVRSLRDNDRDQKNGNKSYGGRVGLTFAGLEGGFSLYKGAYSQDGSKNISLYDLDLEYKKDNFEIRGEYTASNQETDSKAIDRNGFFIETGYKFMDRYQPTLRYDYAKLDNFKTLGNELVKNPVQRVTAGFNFYPLPELNSTFKFKFNYAYIIDTGVGKTANEFVFQSAIGF